MTTPAPDPASTAVGAGLDASLLLALGMHAQPGVYAVLLGSGVSTGAHLPTARQIVEDLVGRLATLEDPDDADAVTAAVADPEAWWSRHGEGELTYATLLERVAPTQAARQGLLKAYFEPTAEDVQEGRKTPSAAHRALARLVARGTVRLIITTNFDRLTERALEEAGIAPQVIAHPDAVAGAAPFAHATVTVVKLHGDYLDLGSRNTPTELDVYPEPWNRLLDQVFSEYGLLVSGWSAATDTALVRAIERGTSRRYPLYWDSRSCRVEGARRLLAGLRGVLVPADSADTLFTRLADHVKDLDTLAEPPLSTDMAVTRLKRHLLDPSRRIDVHDLVFDALTPVRRAVARNSVYVPASDAAHLQHLYDDYRAATTPLLRLALTGIRHDREGFHDDLWVEVLQTLVNLRSDPPGTWNQSIDAAQHTPALLFLAAAGIATTVTGRDRLLIRLSTETRVRRPHHQGDPLPATHGLHYDRVWDKEVVNALPRWAKQPSRFPVSRLLEIDLRDLFDPWLPDPVDFRAAFHGFEYRWGLLQHVLRDHPAAGYPIPGTYAGELAWRRVENDLVPDAEVRFLGELQRAHDPAAWLDLLSVDTDLDATLDSYREELAGYRRHF
jgi:hypothetical protein